MAHDTRHSCPALEPGAAQDPQRVAILGPNLRVSKGTSLGAPIHQSPQAEGRKPLVGSRGAVPVSPLAPTTGLPARDGYRLASGVYDAEPNPMLALEERFLERLLPAVDGLDIVDLG